MPLRFKDLTKENNTHLRVTRLQKRIFPSTVLYFRNVCNQTPFFAWMALNCCISLLKFQQGPMHRKNCFSNVQITFLLKPYEIQAYLILSPNKRLLQITCFNIDHQTRRNQLHCHTCLIFITSFCILDGIWLIKADQQQNWLNVGHQAMVIRIDTLDVIEGSSKHCSAVSNICVLPASCCDVCTSSMFTPFNLHNGTRDPGYVYALVVTPVYKLWSFSDTIFYCLVLARNTESPKPPGRVALK